MSEDGTDLITTNAGSTGLNLQAANTVIKVDLPWNPAVWEQRIARAHRMGQTQPVQVFVVITESTIEESLLATLSAKKEVAFAALDPESDVDTVELQSGSDDLKARLEVPLGARPEALANKTQEQKTRETAARQQHRDRVAAAGGELLGAAIQFLGQLVGDGEDADGPPMKVVGELRSRLAQCVE